MIQIQHLSKSFGMRRALRDVSLDVPEGQFVTLFGPNGAGKTTLLRIMATLTRPSTGRVLVQGHELRAEWTEVRRFIGFVAHQSYLHPELTALENLRFYGRLYELAEIDTRAHAVAESVGLARRLRDPVRTYSRGMLQRLAIARALLHDPLILLLDEPHTGLDEAAAERLRLLLEGISGQRRTILMTTHDLQRGLALAGRAVILVDGKIAFDARRDDLTEAEWRAAYLRYVGAP